MKKISVAFVGLAVIIAMTILQGCVGTARTVGTQCAKPTLIPSDATHAAMTVTVRIATKTAGAYLRYTLDGSTPTGGSSGNGTQVPAASGKVSLTVGPREKMLKAIAFKPGLADSPIAEGIYVYESPYRCYWQRDRNQRALRGFKKMVKTWTLFIATSLRPVSLFAAAAIGRTTAITSNLYSERPSADRRRALRI